MKIDSNSYNEKINYLNSDNKYRKELTAIYEALTYAWFFFKYFITPNMFDSSLTIRFSYCCCKVGWKVIFCSYGSSLLLDLTA